MIVEITQATFLLNLDNPIEISYTPQEGGNWRTIQVETYVYGFPELDENDILYKYSNNRGFILKFKIDDLLDKLGLYQTDWIPYDSVIKLKSNDYTILINKGNKWIWYNKSYFNSIDNEELKNKLINILDPVDENGEK